MASSVILQQLTSSLHMNLGLLIIGILVAAVWTLIWKGIALWKAAKNDSLPWFIVLLIINTLGILEILYIFIFSKKDK